MAQRSFREKNEAGMALIEFALTLPFLLLILLGTIEFARYAIIQQKLDKTAHAMADFVTQGTQICVSDLNGFSEAMEQIMGNYGVRRNQAIFSSVTFFNNPTPPCEGQDVGCISWQYSKGGPNSSRIGAPGGNAILPADYEVHPGQNIITAEVFYPYRPLLAATGSMLKSLSPHTLYRVSLYKPRQGTLTSLCPG